MIARSPAFINPIKDRELDLRGNKIAMLENLAATQDQFDSIDLSENEIRKLECLAVLPRLKMLLLSNNRVTRLADDLGAAFPNLETLVLSNNQIGTLKELDALAGLPSVEMLSLVDNAVTKQQHYRAFVISRMPNLRVLDYKKVKPAEREAAVSMYGAIAKPERTASAANTFEPGGATATAAPAAVAGPTPEQIAQIKEAIAGASSLDEVAKLEKALKAGNYDYIAKHIAQQKSGADEASTDAMDTEEPTPS